MTESDSGFASQGVYVIMLSNPIHLGLPSTLMQENCPIILAWTERKFKSACKWHFCYFVDMEVAADAMV